MRRRTEKVWGGGVGGMKMKKGRSCILFVLLEVSFFVGFKQREISKKAFIVGVADDNGYGWAIAKSLAALRTEIFLDT
ncbi:hypothetical protein Fmac_008125 [Flemingia macrophylla]|uniref:Enoyl-ACP reductase n=1 Tax=Flemingia macrophylla TaxID=520843 RepID=A0ABD1MWH4_9FABA